MAQNMKSVPSVVVDAVDIDPGLNQNSNDVNYINILIIFTHAMQNIPSLAVLVFEVDVDSVVNQIIQCSYRQASEICRTLKEIDFGED